MPRLTSTTSSSALRPCQMAGASLPHAIFTPASIALDSDSFAFGNTSAALACVSFGCCGDVPVLGERVGRHEERAGVDQPLDRVVGDHEPVLDAVDAGVDRGVHRGVAVAVRGDPQPAPVRLVGDRGELLGRSTAARPTDRSTRSRHRTRST